MIILHIIYVNPSIIYNSEYIEDQSLGNSGYWYLLCYQIFEILKTEKI